MLSWTHASRAQNQSLARAAAVVDTLQGCDGEGTRFASPGLGQGDNVVSLNERDDGALLDGRRPLVTFHIDATQQCVAQAHVIEVCDGLDVGKQDVLIERLITVREVRVEILGQLKRYTKINDDAKAIPGDLGLLCYEAEKCQGFKASRIPEPKTKGIRSKHGDIRAW